MSQIVDRRRGHPASIDASGQHLPDILADFRQALLDRWGSDRRGCEHRHQPVNFNLLVGKWSFGVTIFFSYIGQVLGLTAFALLLAYGLPASSLNETLSRQLTAYILLHRFIDVTQFPELYPQHTPTTMRELQETTWGF